MRIAYCIPEATDAYSEYMIGLCIAFPLQQWSHERASTYVIFTLQPVFVLLKIDRVKVEVVRRIYVVQA